MLNKQIAQKIVDKISTVLPYNINIMDKEGIIIGSSNKNRIGTIHYGAAEALTEKKEVEIYNEDEFVKPGLNIPIFFKDEIEGVIGITGNPEDISAFGKIIKVTSELLLYIHRNTLNYRLNNIEEITGLKLNDYMDLYQLILFFLCIRMKNV